MCFCLYLLLILSILPSQQEQIASESERDGEDARKSFSVHHQTSLCPPPPLSSFPLSVFTSPPPAAQPQITACVTLSMHPCACGCVCGVYLCVTLFLVLSPCCNVAGHTYIRQPGREEADEDGKSRQEENRGRNRLRIEIYERDVKEPGEINERET